MIPEMYKDYTSYSRYRSFDSSYPLSDEYFCRVVDGNLICTDTECDTDCDGNIVLVNLLGDVIHIGQVPVVERGTVSFSFDSNDNLHMKYREYLDCDLKHSRLVEEVIDTHLTEERGTLMRTLRLLKILKKEVKGWYGGSLRNSISYAYSNSSIVMYGEIRKIKRYGAPDTSHCSQKIEYIEGLGYTLMPDNNGKDPIFDVIGRRHLLVLLNKFNVQIGVGKETTYFVTSVGEDFIAIADTKDGSCERIPKSTAVNAVISGATSVVGIDVIEGKVFIRPVSEYRK